MNEQSELEIKPVLGEALGALRDRVHDLEVAYHEREMIANDAFRRSSCSLDLAKSKYEIARRRFNLAIDEVRSAAGT